MNDKDLQEAATRRRLCLEGEVTALRAVTSTQLVLLVLATALLGAAIGVYLFGASGRLAAPISLVASLCGLNVGALGLRSSRRTTS